MRPPGRFSPQEPGEPHGSCLFLKYIQWVLGAFVVVSLAPAGGEQFLDFG